MKEVIISIVGTQSLEKGLESIELVTDGHYSFDNGKGILTYMESEITGMDGTKTTFEVGDDLVIDQREPLTVNDLKGKKHFSRMIPHERHTRSQHTQAGPS